jgi:hypothetical protein
MLPDHWLQKCCMEDNISSFVPAVAVAVFNYVNKTCSIMVLKIFRLFVVSLQNSSDVNKGGQSPCALHTIGGSPVYICQPGAHLQ